jgi:NAD+ diphosphatase
VTVPALSRAAVDRDSSLRTDPSGLQAAWERARVLVVDAGRVLVDESSSRPALVFLEPDAAPDGDRLYLGSDDDGPVFAVAGPLRPRLGLRAADLRALGAVLADRDAGLLVHAVGLVNWHVAHPRCARCGAPTDVACGGSVRRCPEDGSEHFPRTDPAVIVLVTDGADRCVLGRQPVWPPGRYSTLAGFVEPGESAEQAVVRELREETGLAVCKVRYVSSQPWPFPSSLMLGFTAMCDGDAEPHPADGELDDVRWFTREEVRGAATWGGRGDGQGGLQLPGEVSIARHLIDAWLAGDERRA